MNKRCTVVATGLLVGLAVCEGPAPTAIESTTEPDVALAQVQGGPDRARGGGFLDFGGGLLVQFGFRAIQTGQELQAKGNLHFSVVLGGELIEFKGRGTCLALDAVEGRAWIGGVITHNNSTHPSYTTEIHQPGRDIWFRVLDSGEGGPADPDRSTFVGFEGGGGIITSQEYCESQIWPDDNARTVPQASGNIQVMG